MPNRLNAFLALMPYGSLKPSSKPLLDQQAQLQAWGAHSLPLPNHPPSNGRRTPQLLAEPATLPRRTSDIPNTAICGHDPSQTSRDGHCWLCLLDFQRTTTGTLRRSSSGSISASSASETTSVSVPDPAEVTLETDKTLNMMEPKRPASSSGQSAHSKKSVSFADKVEVGETHAKEDYPGRSPLAPVDEDGRKEVTIVAPTPARLDETTFTASLRKLKADMAAGTMPNLRQFW